jgi:hypothetical protein
MIGAMSVPSRAAAAAVLLSLDPPTWHLRHARAVAEIAGWLAARCEEAGDAVDRGLVEAAALLHDVDKALPRGGPARALPHGDAELAGPVAAHPVTRLVGPDADGWLATAPLEELVVAYADKRAGQRLEPLAVRFAGWRRRYPDGWSAADEAAARDRAEHLEVLVCARAGVDPGAVRRLRWTGRALAAARGAWPEAAA